jgi:hypothetical protein
MTRGALDTVEGLISGNLWEFSRRFDHIVLWSLTEMDFVGNYFRYVHDDCIF